MPQINELVYDSVYGFEFNFHYIPDYLSHHAKRKTMSKLNFSIPKIYTRGLEIDNWDDLGKEQQQLFLQKNWYINEDMRFCADIILENLLSVKVSHSLRFTNSLSAFEAFSKRFELILKNPTTEKFLKTKKNLLSEISKINEVDLGTFISKMIRTRAFYVHGNKKQTNHFSEFELL